MEKQYDQESFMKKYLTTEVKYVVGIAIFIIWVVAPYYEIKQDIALIKENHLTHIENFAKDIDNLYNTQTKQQEIMIGLMTEIAKMSK